MTNRVALILFLIAGFTILSGCNFADSLAKHEMAQNNSDFIMTNLNRELVISYFPTENFDRMEVADIVLSLEKNCDWPNREGKFVDFYTIGGVGTNDETIFIYEYYFGCDSMRFLLSYNMSVDTPRLQSFLMQPLEDHCEYIRDPSLQLQPSK